LGKANKKERKLYGLVLNCQKKCVKKIEIGKSYKDLDLFARKSFGRYKKYFMHALGHGVGLRVHTRPRISPKSEDEVQKGDVIAIEPGIYIKDKKKEFGIRVEDTIYVGRKVEILSKAPKNFIEIERF